MAMAPKRAPMPRSSPGPTAGEVVLSLPYIILVTFKCCKLGLLYTSLLLLFLGHPSFVTTTIDVLFTVFLKRCCFVFFVSAAAALSF